MQQFKHPAGVAINLIAASATNWQGFQAFFDNLTNHGKLYSLGNRLP
ncbi:hypothetical protein NG799_23735 [Laspinema sp. D1]|uniref:Uncharacterized protein n=1 Tax=Laspinema palackyanum D2a TaxID=2953684 RepID=A0ABT2MXS1_9CYAN|nr:hypothetical protein [Laspinema sp. D2a]